MDKFANSLHISALFVTFSTSLLLVSSVCGHSWIHHSLVPFCLSDSKNHLGFHFCIDYLKQFTTLLIKVARFERKHRLLIQSGRWCLNRDPVSQNPGSVRVSLSASALFPRQCGNNASKSAGAGKLLFVTFLSHRRGEIGSMGGAGGGRYIDSPPQ